MGLSLDIGCGVYKHPRTLGVDRQRLRNVCVGLDIELEAVKPL
jgi:hypothetical protein